MAIGIQEIAFLVITILFGILLCLFIFQTTRRRRSANALIISLSFGFLACVFAIISTGQLIPLNSAWERIFQALQLNTFGVQFFFFFIFLERVRAKDVRTSFFAVMVGLLLLQTFSLWLRVYFHDVSEINATLWFLSDMGYTISGILVYLGLSLPVYFKTYKYTQEKKPIFIAVALALVGVGFVFSFFKDFLDYIHINVEWLDSAAQFTMPLQAIGLFIFTIIYLVDIDYLYRLPNDNFMLIVATTGGLPIFTVKLKTRNQVKIEGDLLSGLLSAINSVFEEIFKSKFTA